MDLKDFKKGDLVRIHKKVSSQKNWANFWNREMDKFVDVTKVRVIHGVNDMGISMEDVFQSGTTHRYCFPSDSLILDLDYTHPVPEEKLAMNGSSEIKEFNDLVDPVFIIDPKKLNQEGLLSFIARTEFELIKLKGLL